MSKALIALLLAGVASTAQAAAAAPEGALQAVRDYSAAFNAADCGAVLALTSPSLLRRIDNSDGGRAQFCDVLAAFHRQGLRDRTRVPTAVMHEGRRWLVLLPNSRTGLLEGLGPFLTEGTYAVHSADGGRTWRVLDLGCVDARWLREVYPPYAGTPAIRGAAQYSLKLAAR